jgi:hypothetical protein
MLSNVVAGNARSGIIHGQSAGGALDYKFAARSGDEDYGRAVDFLSTLAVNP